MDKEVQFFWNKKISKLSNIIYFSNRYIGIFGAVSRLAVYSLSSNYHSCMSFCLSYLQIIKVLLGQFGQWAKSVGGTIMLRVLALWENNWLLTIILRGLVACEAISKLAIIITMTLIQDPIAYPITPSSTVCATYVSSYLQVSRLGLFSWLIPSIVGFMLLLLALYKGLLYCKENGFKGHSLVKVVIKDQLLYYVLVIFCGIINILNYEVVVFLPASQRSFTLAAIVGIIGNPAMLSILGSHLFLNLKEEAELGTNVGIGTVNRYDHTLSIPQFAGVAIETSHSEIVGSSDLGNTTLN
ncbi:hypothetical protein PNOK_0310600 [Pyrrhoderma noxium]|uniref:DUF6533 domain-containing protein n=1 Tax=Pyrrhoderma noxium TaxID=2282107 RepID=A0A286ULQ9_9AGAM|nr:hypothetical protein PNOK_0310600 [Pyrrhoderma noxium]